MTKKRSTKSALLSSVLALFLCFTMLIGTTFAWFTDEVTSKGNVIQTGNLDVEMYWADGDENPDTLTWNKVEGAIFNNDKWEPGYVEAKHIKIANEGSLAFKWKLRIVPNGEVEELADVIDVYYVEGATQLTREMLEEATPVCTLRDLIEDTDGAAHGALLPVGETATNEYERVGEVTATIAFKMRENADNYYQDKKIGTDFSLQLMAAQYTYENDSFGNDYDAKAKYDGINVPADAVKISDFAEFTNALTTGGNYEITDSFTVEGILSVDNDTHFYNTSSSNVITFAKNARLKTAENTDLSFYGVNIDGGGSFEMVDGEFTTDSTASNDDAILMAFAGSTLTLGEGTVIENVVSNCPAVAWAKGTVDNRATIILDGATVRNCAGGSGTVVNVDNYGDVYIEEGTVITGNVSYNNSNHGIIRMYNPWDAENVSTLTMNGGEICNNYYSGNGMIGLYYADMTMNGGKINGNSWYMNNEKSNGFYCAIYVYSASHFIMNDGELCNNTIRFGAINSINATVEDCIVINGGTVSNNFNTDNNGSDGFAAVCYPNTVEKHFVISEKANVTGTIWNFLDENDAKVKNYSEISEFLSE